ncbi:Hypothetical predicted protein [Olea europaea subsp. europaea]|uniref:DRBM domain-containing protein n=1 Tax=Olea europaea subsp. europaea TaxID=158383 RepID=A0A8S0R3A9_OLEEU|nr:Hypothetical predicted protein [Olea europaea subsp. europaea]
MVLLLLRSSNVANYSYYCRCQASLWQWDDLTGRVSWFMVGLLRLDQPGHFGGHTYDVIFAFQDEGIYNNVQQEMAQKVGLKFTSYETSPIATGPHKIGFVSIVVVGSDTFQGIEDEGIYKNVLQEMTQRGGLKSLSYETSPAGPHKTGFVSIVVVGSDTFQGIEARTKKQAEANAIKVTYIALTR